MLRFSLISTVQPGRASEIRNGFVRLLALRSARLEAEMPLPPMLDEEGTSVRERYAPMHRLLTQDDDLFLVGQGFPSAAKKLRREHRLCYFGYLARLTREIRAGRRLGTLAMASKNRWSFPALLEQILIAESSLLYLRWLGYRHAAGVTVAARDVKECLDFLLAGQRFRLVTT
ncbi:MAG: hypothetical protein ABSG13_09100 [Bryobacteraceae bacterium]|jgi:hypothetical protein